jgi:hypothetical protein
LKEVNQRQATFFAGEFSIKTLRLRVAGSHQWRIAVGVDATAGNIYPRLIAADFFFVLFHSSRNSIRGTQDVRIQG